MKTPNITAKPMAHLKYRADIDGLRALAVLSVVCFHAFPQVIKGGFVGVDIFFIISGYLISSILFRSLHEGTFSFTEFYWRRILRIFPALIVVLSTCYLIGWLVLLPKEFQQLGKHLVGGAGFVANLFFWQEAGYFDNSSATKPLLHLWSLGVEEQYYIIWPCILLLVWKLRMNALKVAAALIAVSFAVNAYTVHGDRVQAFYSPFSRFWELLLGAFLAYLQLHTINNERHDGRRVNNLTSSFSTFSVTVSNYAPLRNCLSFLGVFLIILAMFFINRKMIFPGWWALLPTLGAYLVISAGPQALINRLLLSSRPMVWVGLISYPLYLWHWPLLSFATIMEVKTPSPDVRGAAVAIAFILAWITYVFIERPIRFGKRTANKIAVLVSLIVLLAGLGGYAYLKSNTANSSISKSILEQIAKLDFGLHFAKWSPCPNEADTWNCKVLNPNKPAKIALIGDSHSVHLASGLAELDAIKNLNIINRNSDGCFPVFEVDIAGKPFYSCTDDFINNALESAIKTESIKVIMLSGYAVWKIRPTDDDLHLESLPNEQIEESANALEKALSLTLSRLVASGKKIIFLVDTPVLNFEPTECLNIRPVYFKWHTPKTPCAFDRKLFEQRNVEYHRIISNAKKNFPTVNFINLYENLCDQNYCYAHKDGTLLYMDHSHLSADGSRYLLKKMEGDFLF